MNDGQSALPAADLRPKHQFHQSSSRVADQFSFSDSVSVHLLSDMAHSSDPTKCLPVPRGTSPEASYCCSHSLVDASAQ
jgi:hypothetical protein